MQSFLKLLNLLDYCLMKVSIQGQPASFHDLAQKEFLKGQDVDLLCRNTFDEVFEDVTEEKAEIGVIAIENTLYGSINQVYDLLLEHKSWIIGEVYLRIRHNLLGFPGVSLENIKEVHSHPVALAQCEKFLDEKMPHAERFEHHDTAGSAEDVVRWGDPTKAAIASKEAADRYNLEILASDIETNKHNYTRFIVIKKSMKLLTGIGKTSIVLEMPEAGKPGALFRALKAFADENINLTKIESRPVIGKAFNYYFYLDFEKGIESPITEKIILQLKKDGNKVTILGSYPIGELPSA